MGAALGLWARPNRKITSSLMAFGGGALLFALSIELFGHVLHEAGDGHGRVVRTGLVIVAMASAALGGLLFNLLNDQIERRGGFLRRHVSIRRLVVRERRAEAHRLIKALSRVRYFRSIPVTEVLDLLPDVEREEFGPGSVLLREGDTGDRLYVIAQGRVAITRQDGDGEVLVAELGPGAVIGEMALVTDRPRSATATATTRVKSWSIRKSDFDHHIEDSPILREGIRHVVEERIHDLASHGHVTPEEAKEWESLALNRLDDNAVDGRLAAGVLQPDMHQTKGNPALAIWLGIALDGIPESLVIGMLTLAAAVQGHPISMAFIVGVFLANLPEAMSSAVTMRTNGMRKRHILLMWSSLCVMTALGALLGSQMLPAQPTGWHLYVIFAMEGLAGGAMLTMIAQTMLPEAFEQGGGPIVGYSTLAGFIAALAVKLIH